LNGLMPMTSNDRISILIADDNKVNMLAIKLTLKQHPIFEVVAEAENGKNAVSKTLELHPSVVLMDIGMPVLDGIEATRQIKLALPDTKILMLSSHKDPEDIAAAMAAGADDYLFKDCAFEKLVMAITSLGSTKGIPTVNASR
jgi:NarL family two-component system response regulator LiaR